MRKRLFLLAVFAVLFPAIANAESFQYWLGHCSANAPAARDASQKPLEATVDGNTIHFVQTLNTYCSTASENFSLSHKIIGNVIQITETFDAKTVAQCTCPISISGIISDLKSGGYRVRFYFDNKYTEKKDLIGQFNAVIK